MLCSCGCGKETLINGRTGKPNHSLMGHVGAKKAAIARTGKKRLDISADLNPAWKGGGDRYCKLLAKQRDNYTCQECGYQETEIMEVDHIIPKSQRPDLRFVLSNLITLCPNCHRRKTIREHKSRTPWNKKVA